MRPMKCLCGHDLPGDDQDGLLRSLMTHVDEAHADLGLTDQQLRDYVEVGQRPERPLERVEALGEVELRPVGPDILDDVLAFFDTDAFADNPAWAKCYCVFPTTPGDEFQARSLAQNRADLAERVRTGRTRGWLAYVYGEPAGWVNATPRSEIRIDHPTSDDPDERVGVIPCFVVAARFRGHGLQRRLLDAAVAGFADQGMVAAEAMPVRSADSAAGAFFGTLASFTRAGFDEVGGTENQAFVRKRL